MATPSAETTRTRSPSPQSGLRELRLFGRRKLVGRFTPRVTVVLTQNPQQQEREQQCSTPQATTKTIAPGAGGVSACYCAPELLNAVTGRRTTACDVYSYGMILYEIATREMPFEGLDINLIYNHVRQGMRLAASARWLTYWYTSCIDECIAVIGIRCPAPAAEMICHGAVGNAPVGYHVFVEHLVCRSGMKA